MNEQNEDQWLDDLISGTINTKKPEFDAEKWKQNYPEAWRALLARAAQGPAQSIKRPVLLKSPVIKFAAAAVIVAITLFAIRRGPDIKFDIPNVADAARSAAEMLTAKSLMTTYRQDGLEAMETQMDEAVEKLEPHTATVTIQELLAEINGT